MNTVFLDTVGLIALWDDTDQWHQAAKSAYEALKVVRFNGVTTDSVMVECGNACARRPYRAEVNHLRLKLLAKGRLIMPTSEEWSQAWDAYDRGVAANAGIVDQSSFIIMRRLGIRQAFTNDEHFRAAGFETLF